MLAAADAMTPKPVTRLPGSMPRMRVVCEAEVMIMLLRR